MATKRKHRPGVWTCAGFPGALMRFVDERENGTAFMQSYDNRLFGWVPVGSCVLSANFSVVVSGGAGTLQPLEYQVVRYEK